jgi:beta-glucosidase
LRVETSLSLALHDNRVQYLSGYITEMQRARKTGVDVRGYFVWSLMDNFE